MQVQELRKFKISKNDTKSEVINIFAKIQAGIRKVPIHDKLICLIKELYLSSSGEYEIDNLIPNKFDVRSACTGKTFGGLKKSLGFSYESFSLHKKDSYNSIRAGRSY